MRIKLQMKLERKHFLFADDIEFYPRKSEDRAKNGNRMEVIVKTRLFQLQSQ